MAAGERPVRRSVTLPAPLARRVGSLAKRHRKSAGRVLVDLIEEGLRRKDEERDRFFALVERLAAAEGPAEQARLKEELARMTFGA